jgi:hypothetical protein
VIVVIGGYAVLSKSCTNLPFFAVLAPLPVFSSENEPLLQINMTLF